MRIKIIRIIFVISFIIIICGLFYVQAIRGQYYYDLSVNNRIRIVHLEGWRGNIKDRNGKVLADNRISYDVMITPQEIKNIKDLFEFLSKALNVDKEKLIDIYRRNKIAPFAPVIVAKDIDRMQAIVIEENKYLFPSLFVQESYKRIYPFDKVGAHILGYVDKVNRSRIERFKEYGYSFRSTMGYSGVEEYYDSYLKGQEGGLQIEVNSQGKQVRLLSIKQPTKGQDITLTIDNDLQLMSSQLLEGKNGVIIVMDNENGEILSMVSTPSYDPNIFSDSRKRKMMPQLFSDLNSPLLNRAVSGVFPPGSVFKVVVAVSGLASKKMTKHTTFDCKGSYELAGMKFGCTHVHGMQNLVQSLAHSCNVYYYNLGLLVGADRMNQWARALGLGEPTHIDLPFEKSGYVPSRRQGILFGKRKWYTGDTLNFSIGQGDTLTSPLQLVKMMATVANDGSEVQPHVIKLIGSDPVETYSFKREVKIDDSVFGEVKKGLRAAVSEYSGTAHVLDIEGLYVAGKTGTAQSSRNKEHHAWFIGYVIGEKRKLSFCVFLEHGGSSQNSTLITRQLLLLMQKDDLL
ncbi:MAG: penicillin-binding protein 2 [Candidatus Omnitrophica bacterium]|nr:penicillin-binding protein 2 [Candidatus Omnitrophota bacterium]MBU1995606.1 penicillin-binding protein 2 [Candidatus Omnitrophota bacterium]